MPNQYLNEVRIISGIFNGKKLNVLDLEGLRPTPEKVRETIFSWIGNRICQARVLDLFAGSGALGLEAVSRGAASVCLIEKDQKNAANLKSQLKSFKDLNATLINADAINFLENSNDVFDIVFIDPPYKLNLISPSLELLLSRNLITQDSFIYVEMRNGSNETVPGYEIIKEEVQGQVKYALLKKSSFFF